MQKPDKVEPLQWQKVLLEHNIHLLGRDQAAALIINEDGSISSHITGKHPLALITITDLDKEIANPESLENLRESLGEISKRINSQNGSGITADYLIRMMRKKADKIRPSGFRDKLTADEDLIRKTYFLNITANPALAAFLALADWNTRKMPGKEEELPAQRTIFCTGAQRSTVPELDTRYRGTGIAGYNSFSRIMVQSSLLIDYGGGRLDNILTSYRTTTLEEMHHALDGFFSRDLSKSIHQSLIEEDKEGIKALDDINGKIAMRRELSESEVTKLNHMKNLLPKVSKNELIYFLRHAWALLKNAISVSGEIYADIRKQSKNGDHSGLQFEQYAKIAAFGDVLCQNLNDKDIGHKLLALLLPPKEKEINGKVYKNLTAVYLDAARKIDEWYESTFTAAERQQAADYIAAIREEDRSPGLRGTANQQEFGR